MAEPLKAPPLKYPIRAIPEPLPDHAAHFDRLAARESKIRQLMYAKGLSYPDAAAEIDAPQPIKPAILPKA